MDNRFVRVYGTVLSPLYSRVSGFLLVTSVPTVQYRHVFTPPTGGTTKL